MSVWSYHRRRKLCEGGGAATTGAKCAQKYLASPQLNPNRVHELKAEMSRSDNVTVFQVQEG